MIVFTTAYDDATRSNLSVARLLINSESQLFEGDATRESLWSSLGKLSTASLFAMSHGRRRFIRAQQGNPPHAIDLGDEHKLGIRRVFAWACLTSAELGPAAAAAGVMWFGFPVKIAAPPDNPRLQTLLSRILQLIIDELNNVNDDLSCRSFLDRIVDYVDSILLEIEALRLTDEQLELEYDSAAQQCFEQFQLRLEAWLPGHENPIRPTRAPKRRYDDLDPAQDV